MFIGTFTFFDVRNRAHEYRMGGWLPNDHRVHHEWLSRVVSHVDSNPKKLIPVLQELRDLIEKNTRIYVLFNSMFDDIPKKQPYAKDPTGKRQVRDYKHMLALLNHILTTAPAWDDNSKKAGMVGVPINAVLDWPMGTAAGFAAFQDPEINAVMKKVLNVWGEFLQSPASAYVLGDQQNGWFGAHGKNTLAVTANINKTSYTFEELFQCDPLAKNHGYKSWDGFFTRHFKEGIRPVASPEDDNVIANACESRPYKVARDVKARDKFWIKGQPYSVLDMLAMDTLSEQFYGGTIYQAFLSALSYHRWHAPVSGKVIKAYVKEGTYYSEPLFEGVGDLDKHEIDPKGESTGQAYLTATATRAIIFIEADNPAIGLMCFLGIGMTEVSTCDITVKVGQHIKKGDEMGMFHFGGSSHVLLFRKGVNVQGFPEIGGTLNVPVRSEVARVLS